MAELMALPCFYWVFLPIAADMTRETLVPHLRTIQKFIKSEPDPTRQRRIADIATGMTVVARHHKDRTLAGFITEIFREEIMSSDWIAETIAICERRTWEKAIEVGRQEGRQEGREQGLQEGRQEGCQEGAKNALLETAQWILPPEIVASLLSITDATELKTAIYAAYKGNAQ